MNIWEVCKMADVTTNAGEVSNNTESTENVDVNETSKPAENTESVKEETPTETKPNNTTDTKASKSGGRKTKADLQAQIDLLQQELNSVVDNSADFNAQLGLKDTEIANLKKESEQYKGKIEKLEAALNSVIESKKGSLPDNMKALIPENQDVIATLNWLLKAEGNKTQETPEVTIGRVIPVTNTQVDTSTNLSAYDKMSSAFAQLFSK